MPEPLAVETTGLGNAGAELQALALPDAPPPISAAGGDAASAAINSTMPAVELPVINGLPAAGAALKKTSSSISAAANMYAAADQKLSGNFLQQFTPAPGGPGTPGGPTTPGGPFNPGGPFPPGRPTTPGGPFPPGRPTTPGGPITPGGPTTPGGPATPGVPITPGTPGGPSAPPSAKPSPSAPARPNSPPGGSPGAGGPSGPGGPGRGPVGPGGVGPTPGASGPGDGHGPAPVRPQAGGGAVETSRPQPFTPRFGEERGPSVAPASGGSSGGGMPIAPSGSGSTSGGSGAGGTGGGSTAGSSAGGGAQKSLGAPAAKSVPPSQTPAAPKSGPDVRAASTEPAPPSDPTKKEPETTRQGPLAPPDPAQSLDDAMLAAMPVTAALAARDAAAGSTAGGRRRRRDRLRLARRLAAALNAPDLGDHGELGFFWVTALTKDDRFVVANSYGLAYIPEGVQLPKPVHMATADDDIPAAERAHWATYPVLAVQGWAAHNDTELRAVIATEEQLANSDPGVAKVLLLPDEIPHTGKMAGRSRLEVVDPEAAKKLIATADQQLTKLLPPAPVNASAPDDQRSKLWFELMKPMMSNADGRETAHLQAFHAYVAHAKELALHPAHVEPDPDARRAAVADWLYWHHLSTILDEAAVVAS